MKKVVVRPLGNLMRGNDAEVTVNGDPRIGVEPMPDPANPHLTDLGDTFDVTKYVFGGCHEGRVNRVQQPLTDRSCRLNEHPKDRHADEQAHDGVGPLRAEGDADRPDQDRQGGQPIGTGMEAIGNEGG